MALLNRLENDRSLARFAGQFVPLKIVTDGNPQWGKWSRKYPIDGNGIPRIYVVRADGQQLFGAVGSLPGDRLPQMMLTALQQSGNALSEVQAANLQQAVATADSALADGDFLTAAHTLSAAVRPASPDELASFAAPALQAGELYEKLITEIDAKVAEAEEILSSGEKEQPFDALLLVSQAESAYQVFPKLKAKAGLITRELKKNKEYADPLGQAETLVKARVLKTADKPSIRARAAGAYTAIIRRFPGTPADQLARAELAEIDPDAKVLQESPQEPLASSDSPASAEFRQWSAGNFKTRAKYLQQKSGKVQLLKEDGKKIVVDIGLLSDEDQAFLRQQ